MYSPSPLEPARCSRAALAAVILALAIGGTGFTQATGFDAALFRTQGRDGATLVDGVLEFDPRIVAGGADCAYLVAINVTDSTETEIFRDRWRGVLACQSEEQAQLPERSVMVVETFQFAVLPGRYSIEVSLEPTGKPDAAQRRVLELMSLGEDEPASDLILARDIGWTDSMDTGQWTIRKGSLGIAADPRVVVDPTRPELSYYMEFYAEPDLGQQAQLAGVIRRPDGAEVARIRLEDMAASGGNRPTAGTIPVQGLPPGDYLLEVQLELGERLVTRSRPFQMLAPDQLASAGVKQPASRGDALDAYFWSLSDEELAEQFDAIVVWLTTKKERDLYESLSPEGRRNFLVGYFRYGAPQQLGKGEESPLDVYLSRVRVINARYGEKAGHRTRSAWRTDRGRAYMLRGKPDQTVERRFPADGSAPYEIWAYYISPGYVYLFVDETQFENYRLIYSTDPSMPALFDWESRAGAAAIDELLRITGGRR